MRHFAFAAVAALAFLSSAAQAQSCGTLVRAMSLDLEDGGNFFAVPVTINGTPRKFLLDTGGAYTALSVDTIKEMGLKIQPSRVVMYDVYGNSMAGQVTVDFGLGPQTVKNFDLVIAGIGGLDGIFAEDVMQNYDIDIDFAARKLNYFLTSHCDGKVIYWPATVVASVPFHGWNMRSDAHMNVPVKIDGHEVTAIVDTGATFSTLDAGTAHQLFDLSPDSPGAVKPEKAILGSKEFVWTFKTLEIGGITVSNPKMHVIPALMGKKGQDDIAADSHVRRITDGMQPTMLIGMDILRKLHLYIAFKEQKLYVTPASDQKPEDVGRTP
jgi:predicted aspartyl protease